MKNFKLTEKQEKIIKQSILFSLANSGYSSYVDLKSKITDTNLLQTIAHEIKVPFRTVYQYAFQMLKKYKIKE
jgi:hypothetical protein